MKNISIIALAAAALVSLGIAIALSMNAPSQVAPPSDILGNKLLGTIETARLAGVRITKRDKKIELAKKDGAWTVADRGNYPLNDVKDVERLINSLAGLRIGQIVSTGDKYARKVGLAKPGEFPDETEEEKDPYRKQAPGTFVELLDASGEVIHSIVLGESSGGTADQPLAAVYVRVFQPKPAIYLALGRVEKNSALANSWLDMEFLALNSIKSIELKDKDPEYQWKVSKESDTASYVLEGLKENEETDSNGVSAFNWSFGQPKFEDVMAKHEGDASDPHFHHAVVTTFDGFSYDLKFHPIKKDKPDNTNVEDKPSTYALLVNVTAIDPAKIDADPALKEKFEKEKRFDGRVFKVSGSNFNSAFKKRSALLKEKEKEADKKPGTDPGGASAVSPPFRIPELPPGEAPPAP